MNLDKIENSYGYIESGENLKANLPTNARQAKALIESASVRGVLIYNNCNKVMMPLLDLTQSQTLLMRSSEVFPVGFFYKKIWVNLRGYFYSCYKITMT